MTEKPDVTMQQLVNEIFGDELTAKGSAEAKVGVKTAEIRNSSVGRRVKINLVNGDSARYSQRETDKLITVSINTKKIRSPQQLDQVLNSCRHHLLGA